MRQGTLICAVLAVWGLTGCAVVREPVEGWPFVRDPSRQFQKPVNSWQAEKQKNIVMQQEDYSCGAAALATVIRYYWGDPVTEQQFLRSVLLSLSADELRDRLENGLSMTDLRLAAVRQGYLASLGRVDIAQLRNVTIPVIVRVVVNQFEHFVVVRAVVEDLVFVADPIRGNLRVPVSEFLEQWTDGVVLVVAKPGASPPTAPPLRDPATLSAARPELWATRHVLYPP